MDAPGKVPRRGAPRRLARWATAAAIAGAACGHDAPVPPAGGGAPAGAAALNTLVRWRGNVLLEENPQVVNVLTRMQPDPRGGFLVADEQENQVRRYGADGRLLSYFGRKGYGPAEFNLLHRAVRLADGRIVALDMMGKGAVFDSAGAVLRTFRTPIAPIRSMRLVGDTLLLLGGTFTGAGRPAGRLHLWSLAHDTVTASFFDPAVKGRAHELAANTAGFVSADVRGDTVAAVFALSDTVYLLGANGRPLRKVPLPARGFRRLGEGGRVPDATSGPVEAREWIGSFSLMSDVWWLPDGTLLVQYQDRVGTEPHWRLVHLRADGTPLFEVMDTPYLLNVDGRGGTLYFVKPDAPAQNAWSRAELAR